MVVTLINGAYILMVSWYEWLIFMNIRPNIRVLKNWGKLYGLSIQLYMYIWGIFTLEVPLIVLMRGTSVSPLRWGCMPIMEGLYDGKISLWIRFCANKSDHHNHWFKGMFVYVCHHHPHQRLVPTIHEFMFGLWQNFTFALAVNLPNATLLYPVPKPG